MLLAGARKEWLLLVIPTARLSQMEFVSNVQRELSSMLIKYV